MTCLNELDPPDPPTYLPNLANAFYFALERELKERVAEDIPTGSADYNSNLGRLIAFKKLCHDKEGEIKQVVNISARMSANHNRQQQPGPRPQGELSWERSKRQSSGTHSNTDNTASARVPCHTR
jgi:hypothetical protein